MKHADGHTRRRRRREQRGRPDGQHQRGGHGTLEHGSGRGRNATVRRLARAPPRSVHDERQHEEQRERCGRSKAARLGEVPEAHGLVGGRLGHAPRKVRQAGAERSASPERHAGALQQLAGGGAAERGDLVDHYLARRELTRDPIL